MSEREPTPPSYVEVRPPRQLRPFVERLWAHRIEGLPPPEGRRLLREYRTHGLKGIWKRARLRAGGHHVPSVGRRDLPHLPHRRPR
jgi:hypothetical protein